MVFSHSNPAATEGNTSYILLLDALLAVEGLAGTPVGFTHGELNHPDRVIASVPAAALNVYISDLVA